MTLPLDDRDVLRLSPGFRLQYEKAQQGHVVLYPEGMINLSESAAEIVELCDAKRDVATVVDALEQRYDGAELRADVFDFLNSALSQGLLRKVKA